MKNIQFIATDMDHTLLTEAGTLPPHFDDYLDTLEDLGVQFAIASGRPLYTLANLFPRHKNQLTLIADNGAVISHRGQILHKTLLDVADYQDMAAFIKGHTDGRPLVCGLQAAIAEEADRALGPVYQEFYHNLEFVADTSQWAGEADKVTIYLPNDDAQATFEQAIAPRYGTRFSATVSGPVWIDIMPQGVNKGNAIEAIGQHLNIPLANMMAFGDTFNDAEMLATVGHGYLMANAANGMAQYAKYRTASNEDYGVLKVLDQVIAAKRG
ncbi:HAD family hydrolase [Lacticaseibacillus daqingensis]|uniref:HAD family hydrolase n=1 Tax=Lacticaseibacillus daqingensis TaxID=2486014 RepID=UPI000F7B98E1|nr:HAD family hydrolase [Lacticaseibacillus daqingensis]